MTYRFLAIAGRHLAEGAELSSDAVMEPQLPEVHQAVERALAGAEYRDMRAKDRLRSVLPDDGVPDRSLAAVAERFGPAAVFATPPNDLPALLRLADQLDTLARSTPGERALEYRCPLCLTRHLVPVALARPVIIACEKCGRAVNLAPEHSVGETSLREPFSDSVNAARKELAGFFREAMARGLTVLVAGSEVAERA